MPAARANILSKSAYDALRRDLAALIAGARKRTKIALSRELATAYWQVGKRIAAEKLSENAGYGSSILDDLAADLSMSTRTLRRCLQFYRAYEKPPADPALNWSHYRELIPLRDPDERAFYHRLAVDNAFTGRQLAAAISSDGYALQKTAAKSREPKPRRLSRPTRRRYNYRGTVRRVLDGDTIELMLDLGFNTHRLQKIRLAALDAEPLDTPGGRAARDFVRDRLSRTDFVVVNTRTYDIHSRYLGHVFYSLKPMDPDQLFEKGDHLNQQLLDRGLAVAV
jgi:endonuclease YncB( thermonuclease family)